MTKNKYNFICPHCEERISTEEEDAENSLKYQTISANHYVWVCGNCEKLLQITNRG